MPRRDLFIVLFAFALSVLVRVPQLNRPLSAHHELCTALVLIVLDNWYSDGFVAHHGGPAISFSGPADLYPPGFTDAPGMRDGIAYYFSHPPLAYDLPYLLFLATGIAPNALGLELFNLFFHLTTALCLYLIVKELLTIEAASRAPVFAAVLYLFMPAPLWFHSNAYMSDMFVQNLWALNLVVTVRVLKRGAFGSWRSLLAFGVTLFLTVYTSWPGVFVAMTVTALAVWRWFKSRDAAYAKLVLVTWTAVSLALGLTAWRYLQVVDADALWAYYTGRFAVRGSAGMVDGPWPHVRQLLVNYRTGYLPVILVALALGIGFRKRILKLSGLGLFALLTGLPVLLDHAFLLQYADHDFAALKGGILLCGLAAIALANLHGRWSSAVLVTTCVIGVLYFYRTNPLPGRDDGRYAQERDMGLEIAAEAQPDEAVFTLGFTPEPQVQWYAKRTLFRVDSLPQAQQLLRAQGTDVGVLFKQEGNVLVHERIAASD
ncbi:MAG: hypothetical protein ABI432_12025 [Flavobacteriales bacterium]